MTPRHQNVNPAERIGSAVIGATLLSLGVRRGTAVGRLAAALAGTDLIYRAVTGHCQVYDALGVDTNGHRSHRGTTTVRRVVSIEAEPEELERRWRDPETFRQVVGHFADVEMDEAGRVRGRFATQLGGSIPWQGQIVEVRPGSMIRWHAGDGAPLTADGTMRFRPAPNGWGTEVSLELQLHGKGGAIGHAVTEMTRLVPDMVAATALRRFKSLVETGEIPTLDRNPSART
jgi:uncharacterized membrane protein